MDKKQSKAFKIRPEARITLLSMMRILLIVVGPFFLTSEIPGVVGKRAALLRAFFLP